MKAHCQCSPTCRFMAVDGEPYHLSHDPRPEKREERSRALAERGRAGQQKQMERSAARRRAKVPLSTAAEIREFLEKLAALAEGSGADVVARVKAGVQAAQAAAALLKDELEKQAKEIAELLERYPQLAKRLEGEDTSQ